jgi:hypothetical protein
MDTQQSARVVVTAHIIPLLVFPVTEHVGAEGLHDVGKVPGCGIIPLLPGVGLDPGSRDFRRTMSLSAALGTIDVADFESIYGHLRTHAPAYENMHIRTTRTVRGKRGLRYLHAMHVKSGFRETIEGMTSGPGILWAYEISRTSRGTMAKVHIDVASPADRERLATRFRKEILDRISSERAIKGRKIRTKWLKGQFYLRRKSPGMPSSHAHCFEARKRGVLDERFLSVLLPWSFELLYP